jgi:pimeloyl-ACP methyl ester carboxylesterase
VRARVVLVHGSRLSAAQWAPQLSLLRPRVEPVAVDLPGHGARAAETFSLDRCAEVVQEAVAAAPAGAPVVVVGHSLGGYAAMAHAARHGSHLAGLVLVGASATPTGPGAAAYRLVATVTERLGPERMERLTWRFLRRRYPPEVAEPVIAGGYFPAATATAWREVMAGCRPAMVARLACPVLLLNGQYDQFRLGERAFLRACPRARVEVLPGATHFANLDRPGEFAEAVLRFVDRVAGS